MANNEGGEPNGTPPASRESIGGGFLPGPRKPLAGLSREALLGTAWNRDRIASRAAAAIQARILFMRHETRKAIRAFLEDDFQVYERELDRDYLKSIRQQASGELSLSAGDFERYVSQWERLVPADREIAAALEELLSQRYGLDPGTSPASISALRGQPRDHPPTEPLPGVGESDDLVGSAEASARWVTLDAGTVLYERGDPPAAMYLLVNGRLQETTSADEPPEVLRRGQVVGQIETLTGEPRATTAFAVRDSELVMLPRSLIMRLAQRDATLMTVVNKQLARRMAEKLSPRPADPVLGTVALVALPDSASSVDGIIEELARHLARFGTVTHLRKEDVDERIRAFGIDPAGSDGVDAPEFVAWLNELEAREQFLLLQVDEPTGSWGNRALKHVDRVVLMVDADGPLPGSEFVEWLKKQAGHARLDLLLVHPRDAAVPVNSSRWIDGVETDGFIHLRRDDPQHVEHFARLLARRGVGVVLSGGGARGYAHAGAVRAIIESGIPVDAICGTSIGALVAAGYASSMPPEEVVERLRANATRKALIDLTLPVSAVLRGRKVSRVFQTAFGHTRIEDLWRPYFCVSTNLTRARQVVHRRGPLWKAIRASTAIPGIFPPLRNQDGDLLVDGALMNSLPVDLMLKEPGIGTIIAINVTPIREREQQFRFGSNVDGWRVAFRKMLNPRTPAAAPSVFDTLLRANEVRGAQGDSRAGAALVIEPPMEDFPVLGLSAAAGLIDFGYEHGQSAVAQWLQDLAAGGSLPWEGASEGASL